MEEKYYCLIFTGEINTKFSLNDVKQNFIKIFKMSHEQIEILFSSKRAVIKNKITLEQAEKYKKAIEQAGGCCLIEALASNEQPVVTHSFSLAPVGAQLGARKKEHKIVEPDLSHLSIAPAGATLGNPQKEVTRSFPNINQITLAEVGATLSTQEKKPPPLAPDVSHIRLQ